MRENDSLLKILVVDDEPFIRQGLAALIDWEAEGYYIAGEASNGINAIKLLKENKYDLIISDIKMPEMDGIEFVTKVKQDKISEAKFIFLSGYYDFQYAKTAIQYNCCDYILKPIEKEELLISLRKIREEYQKEAGKAQDKKVYEKAYLDRNLMAVIWGKYDEVNLKYIKETLMLSSEIAYIHIEIYLKDEKFATLPEDKKREQQRKLYNFASLLLKKQADHIIFDVTKQVECYDIGLIYCTYMSMDTKQSSDARQSKDTKQSSDARQSMDLKQYSEEELSSEKKQSSDTKQSQEEWLNWFLKELSERMGYEVVACAGSKVKGIENLVDSYREATMTRFFRFFQKQDNKSLYTAEKKDCTSKNPQEEYYRKELDQLVHAIDIGDKSMIKENVKSFYCRLMNKHTDSEIIGLNIQYLLYRLLGLAYEQDGNINQEEVMQYIREAVFSQGTLQGNELKFLKFAEEFADYLMQLRNKAAKGTISQIEAEIEEKYAQNLSLKSLGEKYYINSAYLGQVFKKQYGCTFKDYLTGVRIRKAAEMLLRTDKKVYEIAEKVGYKNLEYFINKFEGIYGFTPTRFRKRNSCS